LDGRLGDQFLKRASAFRAFLDGLIGELLDFFETVFAFLALIFVEGHG
jgi:hypothetical protein